jgi:hypothetical protein
MNGPNDSWVAVLKRADALEIKASIVEPSGRILAVCHNHAGRAGRVDDDNSMLGFHWQEMVTLEDTPRLMEWFADLSSAPQPIVYTRLALCDGEPALCRVALVKAWLGAVWLVVGAMEPAGELNLAPPERLTA